MTGFSQQHGGCIMCGAQNPVGMELHFCACEDDGVEATLTVPERFQGYRGIVHGGIVASLLDAAMTHCVKTIGHSAVTADLNVRYKHPVPIDTELALKGILVERTKHLFRLKAHLSQGRAVLATASARFVQAPADFIQ